MSARPRPMKRLTDAMVFSRVLRPARPARRSRSGGRRPRGSAPPRAGSRGPAHRAGIRPRRCAPPPPANGWCPGRCRPRCAAGAGRATGRVLKSAASAMVEARYCPSCSKRALDVLGKALDEHEGSDLLRRGRGSRLLRPAAARCAASCRARAGPAASCSASRSPRVARLFQRLAPLPSAASGSRRAWRCCSPHRSARRAARTGRRRA